MNLNYCLLLLYFSVSMTLFCQSEQYSFREISTVDGLSQSSVIAIEQDHLGQVWLGTRDGLNKYNGNTFTVYRNDSSDSLSISNNDILSLEEDSEGFIWVGTYYGLNRYNPQQNKFQRYFNNHKKNSIKSNTIWCIKEVFQNQVWIGTSAGVSIYNKDEGSFSEIPISSNSDVVKGEVHSILKTKNQNIWIGTSQGLYKLESDKNVFSVENKTDFFVQDLIEAKDGTLWIGTKNAGLYLYEEQTDQLKKYNDKNDLIHRDVRALSFDKNENLWAGTYNGVNIIKPEGEVINIESNPYRKNSLSKNTIKSIFTDKKGSVWIGAYYGGVNIWDQANENFQNYSQNSEENGLSYDVVSSIEADKNKKLYFGTEGGGITVLNESAQEVDYLNTSTVNSFPSNHIKSLLLTNNSLFVGTFNKGFSLYNIESNKIEDHHIAQPLQDYLQNTGVYSIKQEKENVFWIGSFGKGLLRYDKRQQDFIKYTANIRHSDSILSNNIRTVLIDKENSIWVGTDKGLNHLSLDGNNPAEYETKRFLFDEKQLIGEDILTLFQDSQQRIWGGTKYKGLFLYNGTSFEEVSLQINNKEITAIHAIVEDSQNHLWLSTNQGIIDYDIEQKVSTVYSQKDGLVSNEFNDNASLYLNTHKIYFGGPAGVSSFNPQNITTNTYTPKVILTDFKIQNSSVDHRKENEILDKSITYTSNLHLAHDQSNFTINFAIPNFISSGNNLYAYRLKGLEEEWNITSNPVANYIIQNAGNYTFEVKGANNDGIWNEEPTTLGIKIKPAPWRSWWAFLLYAVLIAAALYGLIWIRKSQAQLRHKLELERIESEKNKDLNQAKLEFFTNISHEFRTPLTLILGPLQQLLQDYKGSNLMYKKLLVIESSANHLLQLINRLMDFRKLENNQYHLQAAEGNIVKFLREIFLSFSEYAENGNYEYSFETSDEEILVYYDRPKLERVFYNLISNAFRYTPKGGQIKIEVKKYENTISIEVKDTGIGIPEESLDKVFERFYEVGTQQHKENYNKGTGIGLSIAKNIVKLHKGEISVRNQEKGGAIFRVELKLGREHLAEEDILKDFKFSDDISQYANQLEIPEQVYAEEVEAIEDLVTDKEKRTILLVEDSSPLRSFMKNLLKEDYNILEAENGKVALQKAQKYIPDLIVSDVIMPEMVGTELCSQIKKNLRTSHIPVILLTSRSALVYKFEGLESGADDYISKPFNVKEFKLRVKNLIGSTQRLKEKFSNENNLSPSDITVSSLDEKLLKKALEIVEENISNDQFNIPTFSAELGVSRTMLFTKIKAWTNFTPNEFIQEIRMKRAAQLLEQGKINISQVSYKVGYNNPKYFAKSFQKKYGLTPTQYANKFFVDI